MLNFDEELEKFKPSMEVDDIEEALYRENLSDLKSGGADRREDGDREDR